MPIRPSTLHPAVAWCAVVAIVLATGMSSACAARRFDTLMRNWQGHSMMELLSTWGPPRYAYSDGQGGYVLLYVPASEGPPKASTPSYVATGAAMADGLYHNALPASQPVYATTTTDGWRVFRLFSIDQDGKINRSQWTGEWACCGN